MTLCRCGMRFSDEGKRNQEKANENLNNNRIPVKIESVAKLPFEHRFFLRISEKCREENVKQKQAKMCAGLCSATSGKCWKSEASRHGFISRRRRYYY